VDQGHDGKREYYWIIRGIPEWSVVPGTDVWALEENKISIMPFPGSDNIPKGDLVTEFEQKLLGKSSVSKPSE